VRLFAATLCSVIPATGVAFSIVAAKNFLVNCVFLCAVCLLALVGAKVTGCYGPVERLVFVPVLTHVWEGLGGFEPDIAGIRTGFEPVFGGVLRPLTGVRPYSCGC